MEVLAAAFVVFIVYMFGYLLIHGPFMLARHIGRSLEQAPETPETRDADEIMSRANLAGKTPSDGD